MRLLKVLPTSALLLPLLGMSCAEKREVELNVRNTASVDLGERIVEVDAREVLARLGTKAFYVTDDSGREIPSQLTYDSLIIFNAEVPKGESRTYKVLPSDTVKVYPATVGGRVYPQRRDDLAYENEVVGFRIYGPGTQQAGERAYGYDLFFKHPAEELIVPGLYAAQTSEENWRRVDSLRNIDPKAADELVNSFSYHIDHGKGMDCYAVSSTLGAGVSAIYRNGNVEYPWCYDSAEILDNGPLRFTVSLSFAPVAAGDSVMRTEHRLISLDSHSHLNRCKVWYDGLAGEEKVVTGFPLRDESIVIERPEEGVIAYADPTQGPDNGKALIGVLMDSPADSVKRIDGHAVFMTTIAPGDTLSYGWGFAWDRADITSLDEWSDYLQRSTSHYKVEIK